MVLHKSSMVRKSSESFPRCSRLSRRFTEGWGDVAVADRLLRHDWRGFAGPSRILLFRGHEVKGGDEPIEIGQILAGRGGD
jgi:hypothetical protein